MSLLNNVANDLQKFADNLQETLSNRLAKISSSLITSRIANQSVFSSSAISQINNIIAQYKTNGTLDPRVQQNINQGNNGNRLFFSSNTLMENEDYFSELGTMDVYQVNLQGVYLRGLLGSKEPTLPMAFNAVLPVTAAFVGAQSPANPLYLFVNPKTWNRTSTKVLGKQWVRKGIKTERWGDELEQIQAEGQISAFYTQESGLTRFYKRQAPSFRNLMQLVQLYRNNGCVYGSSYTGNETAIPSSKRIIDVGFVEILYGYELFRGSFESFTISEDATKPFTMSYNFIFNVAETISIYDMIEQSSEFSQSGSAVTLSPGQQLNNINQLGDVTAFNASGAQEYKKTVEENTLNGKNLDVLNNNTVPLIKLK